MNIEEIHPQAIEIEKFKTIQTVTLGVILHYK